MSTGLDERQRWERRSGLVVERAKCPCEVHLDPGLDPLIQLGGEGRSQACWQEQVAGNASEVCTLVLALS
jgi:hypothetical protein